MITEDEKRDRLVRRCPRLGGPIPYEYCRTEGGIDGYCHKIIDCWWEIFDVVSHLKKTLPPDRFEKLMESRPKPKVQSIIELIREAKERIEKEKQGGGT